MPKPFDYPAFRAAFHAAAIARGVDPTEGATSYQAALVKADAATARTRRENGAWWARASMWLYAPPYRNEYEAQAIYRVWEAAFILEHRRRLLAAARRSGTLPRRRPVPV